MRFWCLLHMLLKIVVYSKTCLKRPLKKKTKFGFQDRLLLNAGQKYLLPYFVYTNSKDSDYTETVQTCLSVGCLHMQFVPKSCVDSTIQ